MKSCSPDISALQGVYDALTQAQDCLRGETPEDVTDAEAREDTINKVRDAMRTIEAMQAAGVAKAPAWQPIETAPKDGTAIIIGFWYQGRFAQYQGFWTPSGWRENSRYYFPKHMQGWFSVWTLPPSPPASPIPSTHRAPDDGMLWRHPAPDASPPAGPTGKYKIIPAVQEAGK